MTMVTSAFLSMRFIDARDDHHRQHVTSQAATIALRDDVGDLCLLVNALMMPAMTITASTSLVKPQ